MPEPISCIRLLLAATNRARLTGMDVLPARRQINAIRRPLRNTLAGQRRGRHQPIVVSRGVDEPGRIDIEIAAIVTRAWIWESVMDILLEEMLAGEAPSALCLEVQDNRRL